MHNSKMNVLKISTYIIQTNHKQDFIYNHTIIDIGNFPINTKLALYTYLIKMKQEFFVDNLMNATYLT